MNAPLIVKELVGKLERRYGKASLIGRSRILNF